MDILLSIVALILFVLLTASTGLFVAIEFALTGMERSTVESHVRDNGDKTAHAVADSHQNLSFVLSGAQLGITITTLATGYLAEPVLAQYFTPLLDWLGLSESASSTVALILALIVATFLSMVFGELVPKNAAITHPLGTARVVVHPVAWFNKIFGWFIRAMNSSANRVVRAMGIEPADELASARSAQELGSLVRNSAETGQFEPATAEMIDRSLQFGETVAEEFMTPRSTVEYLRQEDTVADLIGLAAQTGHSRFPVVAGDLDETIGVVHIKDAFSVPREERGVVSVGKLARKVPIVPDTLDGDSVLNKVRSAGSQLVMVADEYGGTAGIVTIEDVVEEILGEVYDEHDEPNNERDFQRIGSIWQVSGLVRLDEVKENIGYEAPHGSYETLGGLVMATLGKIPEVGDQVVLPQSDTPFISELDAGHHGRWQATVTVMDGRRVDTVSIAPISDEEAES